MALGAAGTNYHGGIVNVYDLVDGAWVQLGPSIPVVGNNDFQGSSVSHSKHGIWLAAGGSRANNIAGYVRIFYGHFPFAGRDVFYSNFIRWPLEDRADREKVSIKLIILNLF